MIQRLDVNMNSIDILRDLSMVVRPRPDGAPQRIDGMTVGIVTMQGNAPHGGEMHPDGDELLFVISGRLSVVGDSDPNHPVVLGPGEACIVRQGEWHRVDVLEPTQLVHITPGPGGDHRPL